MKGHHNLSWTGDAAKRKVSISNLKLKLFSKKFELFQLKPSENSATVQTGSELSFLFHHIASIIYQLTLGWRDKMLCIAIIHHVIFSQIWLLAEDKFHHIHLSPISHVWHDSKYFQNIFNSPAAKICCSHFCGKLFCAQAIEKSWLRTYYYFRLFAHFCRREGLKLVNIFDFLQAKMKLIMKQ